MIPFMVHALLRLICGDKLFAKFFISRVNACFALARSTLFIFVKWIPSATTFSYHFFPSRDRFSYSTDRKCPDRKCDERNNPTGDYILTIRIVSRKQSTFRKAAKERNKPKTLSGFWLVPFFRHYLFGRTSYGRETTSQERPERRQAWRPGRAAGSS